MSKKPARVQKSAHRLWTTVITGSVLAASAQAAEAGSNDHSFKTFRTNFSTVGPRALRQEYRARQAGRGNELRQDSGSHFTGLQQQSSRVQETSLIQDTHLNRFERKLERGREINPSLHLNAKGNLVKLTNGVNFDLSSQVSNIALGSALLQGGTVEIVVGDKTKTFEAGSKVTIGEYVAVKQALAGEQQIVLDNNGRAIGGSVDLDAITSGGSPMRAVSLTVPVNVTASGDFAKNADFRLHGDLSNYGNIEVYSSNAEVKNGAISADDIFNHANASIESNVGLTINAYGSLLNMGTIKADDILTINTGNVRNAGTISSTHSAVNFNGIAGSALNLDNQGGSILAKQNDINIVNLNGDINLNGGDWLSQRLNIDAGSGALRAHLNDVTGQVNVKASFAELGAATENLNLGNIKIDGDPTWYNTAGNVLLSGDITASGLSPNIAVLAGGHIISVAGGPTSIDSSAFFTGGNAGAITLVAGAKFILGTGSGSNNTDTSLTITNPDPGATGGGVYLNGSAPSGFAGTPASIGKFSAEGMTGNNSGGDVQIIAYAGTSAGSGIVRVGAPIMTGGSGSGSNGDVTIIAGATSGNSITALDIDSSGSTGTAGSITIATATPTITGTGSITILGGAIQSGSGSFAAGVVQNGDVSTGNLLAAGAGGAAGNVTAGTSGSAGGAGGALDILAGGNITTGYLRTFGGGGGGTGFPNGGGSVGGAGGAGGSVNVTSANGSITINADVNTSGGGGGGSGSSTSLGGGAGNVTLDAGTTLTIAGPILAAGGGNATGVPSGYSDVGGSCGGGGGGAQ
ncbi:MAG: hypothetical protein SGJ27_28230, partial [Candidatus Melainabacteria bacterium]|nr:hypothetical protein [Candidatus Melainabacteria bacterium]